MPGQVLFTLRTDIEPAVEDEFNAWYDEEHIPELLAVPGMLTGTRYRALVGEPKYLAIYDARDIGVFDQPEFRRVRPTDPGATPRSKAVFPSFRNIHRGTYEHLITLPQPEPADLRRARALLLMGLEVSPLHEEEFNDWYNLEHLPALVGTPGVVRARRFRLHPQGRRNEGSPCRYVALYDLERPEVWNSDAWKLRRASMWSDRMAGLFTRREADLYERIGVS